MEKKPKHLKGLKAWIRWDKLKQIRSKHLRGLKVQIIGTSPNTLKSKANPIYYPNSHSRPTIVTPTAEPNRHRPSTNLPCKIMVPSKFYWQCQCFLANKPIKASHQPKMLPEERVQSVHKYTHLKQLKRKSSTLSCKECFLANKPIKSSHQTHFFTRRKGAINS